MKNLNDLFTCDILVDGDYNAQGYYIKGKEVSRAEFMDHLYHAPWPDDADNQHPGDQFNCFG